MKGRTVIVTGANRGLGLCITRGIARLGARVVMACRSVELGRKARDELSAETGNADLEVMALDLASPGSVSDFASAFTSGHERLDVLVNNAGIQTPRKQLSGDGIELVFATNVLGGHLLTRLLLDILKASRPSRIVNVASTFAGKLDLEDLQFERRPYDHIDAYKQSKQANRMLSWELARRLEGTGVTVNAMAPGLMMTDLYRDSSRPTRLLMRFLHLLFGVSVEQGADTAVWLATSRDPAVEGVSGKFFEKRRAIPCEFANDAAQRALRQTCEALIRTSSATSG
jgi:NAD(P)-dependent dehydrogenase (short-subunit alcohol dehydrogenase family)